MRRSTAARDRSTLVLAESEHEALRRHAERVYPEECCGILIGSMTSDGARVSRLLPAVNQHRERPHERYEIGPLEILRAQRLARSRGEDIVGYYHSHPDHEAQPSVTDRAAAWPGVSYAIVSVHEGEADDVRSWRCGQDGLVEEVLSVVSGLSRDRVSKADQ